MEYCKFGDLRTLIKDLKDPLEEQKVSREDNDIICRKVSFSMTEGK